MGNFSFYIKTTNKRKYIISRLFIKLKEKRKKIKVKMKKKIKKNNGINVNQ